MSEIFFYHLTRTSLENTVPGLLIKTKSRGWKAIVRGIDVQRMTWLDDVLWRLNEDEFLAHGCAGGEHDAQQPVLLTTQDDNANNAELLILMDGATVTPDQTLGYKRVCLIFDGNDPQALTAARVQWKTLTDAKIPATYWSQESGAWQAKISVNKDTQ